MTSAQKAFEKLLADLDLQDPVDVMLADAWDFNRAAVGLSQDIMIDCGDQTQRALLELGMDFREESTQRHYLELIAQLVTEHEAVRRAASLWGTT